MDIKTITVKHPTINNRDITLLLIDNNIDHSSAKFFVHEARYGGRHGGRGGRSSHKGKATQIAELYRHLNDMGLDWRSATETDIKRIRNAMLCWDTHGNPAYQEFPYEPIKNDTMNHKLNTWFKFYRYMKGIGEESDMDLTTERVKKVHPRGLLDHLSKRQDHQEEYVDIWTLRVPPSPKMHTFHALSRSEFAKLRQHLRNIDVVYEAIAVLMVTTGLRIQAALEAKEDDFKGLIALLSSGKELRDTIERNYIPKGGDEYKKYHLPLQTIKDIGDIYLTREYSNRVYEYEKRCERLGHKIEDGVLWISNKGKPIYKHDVWNAFSEASRIMKRTQNKITPHWLRHTFATWTIMDVANAKGISLENTGTTPNPLLILALQEKLGHADALTTLRYISTALKLMGVDLNKGDVQISLRTFMRDKRSQELVKREAKSEFGEDFDEDEFDVVSYALSRGIVVDDELL